MRRKPYPILTTMQVFYSPGYYAEIGEGHVFPIRKFERAAEILLREGTLAPSEIIAPQPAALSDVLLVHTEDYVTRLRAGALSEREIRRLGLPWSKSLVRRSFLALSGTINAARVAMREGIAANLAGGTHHSFADRGEGFCVFNDVAVATRVLHRDGLAARIAVVDCDVHQGNGTATIFEGEASVFTFSMHGAKNYPLFKAQSTLDIELADGTTDDPYLEILERQLPLVFAHKPDIVFYLAGADPFAGDKLGRLALTIPGLRRRDEIVIQACLSRNVPVVTTMSGGYGTRIEDTVEIHCNTIRVGKELHDLMRNEKLKMQSFETSEV